VSRGAVALGPCLAVALVALVALPAGASNFQVFGFNPRGQAMGGALTAGDADYTAAYYNPAALTLRKEVNFGAGLQLTLPSLFVDRGKRDSDRATILPELHTGVSLGWRYPLGGIFEDKVALGIGVYLPLKRIARVQGIDPASPQFYLYQNLQDKLILVTSVAYAPVPWLSFGVGAQVLADLTGRVSLALDVIDSAFDHASIVVDLQPSASLLAGVHLRPADGLNIGLAFRASSALTFDLPVDVREGEALELIIGVSQTVLWSPHQVGLGVSWTSPALDLTLAVDATLALWSQAPDPSPRLSVDVGGKLLDAFGLGAALDISARSKPIVLGFRDTVVPRLGAEWGPAHWLKVRAGYFFRPTPAPRQSGATAYLDNDAHVASVGAGFVFGDPFEVHQEPVEVDVALQMTALQRRTVYRPPGDPVGALSHGGFLWNLSVAVSHRY
jgi:long-subunit fatty acid transport protein